MKPILAPEARPRLRELARSRALLAFDFDGTLAPIVPDRTAAALREETRSLLRALALLQPCAVVSGRSRADLAGRLARIPLFALVGSHGAEPGFGPLDRSLRARTLGWARALAEALGGAPGLDIEDKRFSIAVHYRHAPSRAAARHLILRVAARLEGVRVFGGRCVVNLVPAEAPDKAVALEDLARRAGAPAALYVGDDRSDEDVFRSGVATAVRVGRTVRSAAAYYLPGQAAVDDLLRALLNARTELDGLGDRARELARAVGS